MRQRYIDTRFVRLTEEEALCATRSTFGETDFRLNFVLDTWLKMQHFPGTLEPAITDDGCFQSYAYFQCQQSPFTLLSAYDLWRRASYVEASVLLRHLLEVFVQLRYFQNHADLCMNHVTEQPKGRVRFVTMFDELAPGSYDAAYRTLSVIAHGNMNPGFRGDLSASTSSGAQHTVPVFVGAQFEKGRAQLVHAFYIIVVLGFVNFYQRFFPANTIASDAELVEDLAEAQKWLESVFEHKQNNVNDPSLFDAVKPLIF